MFIYRGNTFPFSFRLKNYMFVEGDEVRLGVKKTFEDKDFILYKELTFDKTVDVVTVEFSSDLTAEIEPGEYIFEVQVRVNGDKKFTPYQIALTVGAVIIR